MERICIIGCPGSGKSTMAARLAAQTGIPAVHLDQLFWKENWVQRPAAEFDELLAEALKQSRWIMDGNFARTLPVKVRLRGYPSRLRSAQMAQFAGLF